MAVLASSAVAADPAAYLLQPARVFDGVDPKPHEGWTVLVRGDKIEAVGPSVPTPPAPLWSIWRGRPYFQVS